MTVENLPDELTIYSPGRALLIGIAAGFGIILLGTLIALAAGGQSHWSVPLHWFLPLLCAAVAAAMAAHKLGSSPGRVAALAILALLGAFFIRGLLDYVALYDFVSGAVFAEADGGQAANRLGVFWRWQIVVSFLAVILGSLLGVMFGKPGQP